MPLGHVVGGGVGNPFWPVEWRAQAVEGEGCGRKKDARRRREKGAGERDARKKKVCSE